MTKPIQFSTTDFWQRLEWILSTKISEHVEWPSYHPLPFLVSETIRCMRKELVISRASASLQCIHVLNTRSSFWNFENCGWVETHFNKLFPPFSESAIKQQANFLKEMLQLPLKAKIPTTFPVRQNLPHSLPNCSQSTERVYTSNLCLLFLLRLPDKSHTNGIYSRKGLTHRKTKSVQSLESAEFRNLNSAPCQTYAVYLWRLFIAASTAHPVDCHWLAVAWSTTGPASTHTHQCACTQSCNSAILPLVWDLPIPRPQSMC